MVDHAHHLLGRDAVGRQRRDERAGARADVDVELVDRAVDRQQVERAQRADLVDRAGEAAAAQHQRRLGLASPRRAACGWRSRRAAALEVDDLAHRAAKPTRRRRPSGRSDFRGRPRVSVPSVPRVMVRIAALACLAAGPARPRRRSRPGAPATARALAAQMRCGRAGPRARSPSTSTRAARSTRVRADTRRMPASVEKLYTVGRGAAPARRRRTARARACWPRPPPDAAGRRARRPLPARRRRPDVRRARRRAAWPSRSPTPGIVEVTGRVRGDESAFDARRGVPSSGFRLTSRRRPALGADLQPRPHRARARRYWQRRPARFAAAAFAKQLRSARRRRAPRRADRASRRRGGGARDRRGARRRSPTSLRLMNPPSDNFMAETLVKVLGARFGGVGQHGAGHARRARGARASSASRRR